MRMVHSYAVALSVVVAEACLSPTVALGGSALDNGLDEGKLGGALDLTWSSADAAKGLAAYKKFPLTVELWCKLNSHSTFNILVAHEPKESADHWEIYTEAGSGTLSAYLPGLTPAIIKSPKAIADGRWHYVAMVADGKTIALYDDGLEVVRAAVSKKPGGAVVAGTLSVGQAVYQGGTLGCDGAIDDLRLSNIARKIQGVPTAAVGSRRPHDWPLGF